MAREVFFYQCLWVTKFCAKFGRSRIPRTARDPNSFIVLRCMWKEPAPFSFNRAETIPSLFCFFARVHYNSLTVLSALSSAQFYCAALSNLMFHDMVYIQFRSTFAQKKFPVCSALFYCSRFSLKLCTVPHWISCNSLCALYTLVFKLCVSVHCVL